MPVPIAVFRLTEYLDKYIWHPRQQKYPMNLAPFTHPSVYLSVFPFATQGLRIGTSVFSDFLPEVR